MAQDYCQTLFAYLHPTRLRAKRILSEAPTPKWSRVHLALIAAVILQVLSYSVQAASQTDASGRNAADSTLQVMTPELATLVSCQRVLTGHSAGVWSVAFSPDGSLLASGAQDRSVRLWNPQTYELVRTLPNHAYWVIGLTFSSDGQTVAAGEATLFNPVSASIRLWDVATGNAAGAFVAHASGVWSLAYRPGTNILTSCGLDRLIKFWDPSTGIAIDTLVGHTAAVLCVSYNPVQDLLASSSIDRTVRLWDGASGDSVGVLTGHTNNIGFVTFSPDGTLVVSSADDGTIRYWNVSDGLPIRVVAAGQNWVNGLAFSPDGRVLASTGHNGTVRLWDPATGDLLTELTGHTQPAIRVAFSPDGTLIASASWDATVRLWGVLGPSETDPDGDGIPWPSDNCFDFPNPNQSDLDDDGLGDPCDPNCCAGRVGDVNGEDDYPDEVTLGDIMLLVDVKFISGDCSQLTCLYEADINQDGGIDPNCNDHISLGDIMTLVDFLFIAGPANVTLPNCL